MTAALSALNLAVNSDPLLLICCHCRVTVGTTMLKKHFSIHHNFTFNRHRASLKLLRPFLRDLLQRQAQRPSYTSLNAPVALLAPPIPGLQCTVSGCGYATTTDRFKHGRHSGRCQGDATDHESSPAPAPVLVQQASLTTGWIVVGTRPGDTGNAAPPRAEPGSSVRARLGLALSQARSE